MNKRFIIGVIFLILLGLIFLSKGSFIVNYFKSIFGIGEKSTAQQSCSKIKDGGDENCKPTFFINLGIHRSKNQILPTCCIGNSCNLIPTTQQINNPTTTIETTLGKTPQNNYYKIPVPIDRQNYALSCELSSAAMIASYYLGGSTDDWEEKFVREIPKHCNPNRGFRGDVNGIVSIDCRPPYGYGVYNQPVADLLNQNNVPSEALNLKECNNPNDAGYDRLERYIREGRPVIVWISGSNANIVEETYENEKFKLIFGEHAIVVVGVEKEGNDRYFIVNDPLKGERKFRQFKRWADFDCMAVIGPSKS